MLGFKEEEYGDGGVVEGYSKQQWESNKTMEVERWEKRLVYIQEAKDPNITTLPDAIHRAPSLVQQKASSQDEWRCTSCHDPVFWRHFWVGSDKKQSRPAFRR